MKSLILILAFFSASAFAQNSWFSVSDKNAKVKFFVNIASLNINEFGNPEAIIKTDSDKHGISFNFVLMTKKDCTNGYGHLYWYDMKKVFDATSEYVVKGGTNATNIGDILCSHLNRQPSV